MPRAEGYGREPGGAEGRKLSQGERRKQTPRMGREQIQATAFVQITVHRGTGNLPFFAKRKRKRRGGQASVPLHPLLPGEGSPRTPPRREGYYVSSVIMLSGPPGPIPRRAFVVGAQAKHLVRQRAGVRRRAVLGRGYARHLFPCFARGLRRALPSDVEGAFRKPPRFLYFCLTKVQTSPSMRRGLNIHRTPPLLSPCLRFFISPRLCAWPLGLLHNLPTLALPNPAAQKKSPQALF